MKNVRTGRPLPPPPVITIGTDITSQPDISSIGTRPTEFVARAGESDYSKHENLGFDEQTKPFVTIGDRLKPSSETDYRLKPKFVGQDNKSQRQTLIFTSPEDGRFLAICFADKTLEVGSRSSIFTVDFRQVLSVDLYQDDNTITTTDLKSQLSRAAIGNLIFGSVGSVIGAMGAKTQTTSAISIVSLRLIIPDIAEPIQNIVFFRSKSGKISINEPQVSAAIEEANKWHSLIHSAMTSAA